MFPFDPKRFAIPGKKLAPELEAALRRTSAVNELARRLAVAATEDDVYTEAARIGPELLGVDRCTIALVSPNSPTFEVRALDGRGEVLPQGSRMLLHGTAVGAAVQSRETQSTEGRSLHEFTDWEHLAAVGFTNLICAPLVGWGAVFGTLNVGVRAGRELTATDALYTETMARVVAAHLQLRRCAETA